MTNTTQSPKMISKKMWMKIHTYLSLFFLPFALIYVITGIGYICGAQQDFGAKVFELELESMPKKGEERALLLELLAAHHFTIPSNTEIKFIKGNPSIGNVAYSASISTSRGNKPTFKVVERSLYGILLLMHKSSGSKFAVGSLKLSVFDILAMCFGASLVLFYLSGLIVTSFCKHDRIVSFSVMAAGCIVCACAIYASL